MLIGRATPFANFLPLLTFSRRFQGFRCRLKGECLGGMMWRGNFPSLLVNWARRGEPVVSDKKRILVGVAALVLAACLWLPFFHVLFDEPPETYWSREGIPPKARLLANQHLHLWADPANRAGEIGKMRVRNAEWDFMARCYFVWALGNIALRDASLKPTVLPIMDQIIDETIRLEAEKGMYFFLMPYAQTSPWKLTPARSQFLDGEIALMMAVRRVVEEKEAYKPLLMERVRLMVGRMEQSPVLSAESYPDECWLFCNTVALAAIRISDFLDGTDHGDFFKRWVEAAKQKLIEPKTGLLVSAYNVAGDIQMDGPEGSSIWMAVHCLALIDEPFARAQYWRAERQIGRTLAGFGYCVEWPDLCPGSSDVDSGPILPLIDLSTGATGLAFVGAATFADFGFLGRLHRSLNLGGFPLQKDDRLKYCGSNQVGDAVLLYSMVLGPVWQKVTGR